MNLARDVRLSEIVPRLEGDNLLPAIVFRTSRSQCDTDAQHACSQRRLFLPSHRQREIKSKVYEIVQRFDMEADLVTSNPQFPGVIKSGVGAHHAGQLLVWRLLLEELMAAGYLRVLVATGTVAAGVDFPARTVVITAHSRRGAEGYAKISSSDFKQMSGRAGRRGKDSVGFCLVAPSRFCDARAVLQIASRPAEPLQSSYFPSPSSVLNLLRYRNVDDLRYTVERSLASYKDRKEAASLIVEAEELEQELPELVEGQSQSKDEKKKRKRVRRLFKSAEDLSQRQMQLLDSALVGLSSLGYLEANSLSEKGYWASNICTNLVLEIAEVIESGILAECTAEKLIAIIASISGDQHRTYLKTKQKFLTEEEIDILEGIAVRIREQGIPGVNEQLAVMNDAAATVVEWMYTDTWQEFRGFLMLCGVHEGDAARLITQTAEQLNQISRLNVSHPDLAMLAVVAKQKILRPPLSDVLEVGLA